MCSICNLFGGNSFSAVLRHIGEIHRHDPALNIRCGIQRCPQTYNNYESFRSHVYRKHRDVLFINSTSADTEGDAQTESIDYGHFNDEEVLHGNTFDRYLHGAKFLLKTREQNRMPLNKLIGDVKGLWMVSQMHLKDKVKELIENKLSKSEVDDILECFEDNFPLQGLETEYMQLKYYKENLNYLVRKLTM